MYEVERTKTILWRIIACKYLSVKSVYMVKDSFWSFCKGHWHDIRNNSYNVYFRVIIAMEEFSLKLYLLDFSHCFCVKTTEKTQPVKTPFSSEKLP